MRIQDPSHPSSRSKGFSLSSARDITRGKEKAMVSMSRPAGHCSMGLGIHAHHWVRKNSTILTSSYHESAGSQSETACNPSPHSAPVGGRSTASRKRYGVRRLSLDQKLTGCEMGLRLLKHRQGKRGPASVPGAESRRFMRRGELDIPGNAALKVEEALPKCCSVSPRLHAGSIPLAKFICRKKPHG